MMNRLYLFGCVSLWVFCSSSAWADGKAFVQGQKAYSAYRFSQAIPALKQALASGTLSQKQQVNAHLMLAISFYNQTRSKQAAKHYKQALQLKPDLPVPSGQSPPATAFFRRIKQRFVPQKRSEPKPLTFSLTPRREAPPVRRPQKRPLPRVAIAPRARTTPSGQPRPPKPFWETHRISMLVGAAGLLTICVGIGLGAAFQLQKSALDRERLDKTRSGEQIAATYQQTEALVVPTNVVLISGTVLLTAAGGIFAAEWFVLRPSVKGAKP